MAVGRERRALQRRRKARRATALALTAALGAAPLASAQDPDPLPRVGLEQLLRLPDDVATETPRRGGATRSEWQSRFRAARDELAEAEHLLAEARSELEDLASDSDAWQIAAPGAQPSTDVENSPLSFRLRQEIRSRREQVERAERRLQELSVEANLAGVPPEWQQPEAD